MPFYVVLWHSKDSRENGVDLVHAKDKREARRRYRGSHYSPIDAVLSQAEERQRAISDGLNPDTDSLFADISQDEYNRAEHGEVVNVESGT